MNILKTIDGDFEIAKMYAQYWMTMALTGAAKNRKLFHGTDGPEYTDEEKIADAMETANRHIRQMSTILDTKKEFIYNMNKAKNERG